MLRSLNVSEPEDNPRVFICSGPPVCMLKDEEAVEAMRTGCRWCEIAEYDPIADRWTTLQKPGSA